MKKHNFTPNLFLLAALALGLVNNVKGGTENGGGGDGCVAEYKTIAARLESSLNSQQNIIQVLGCVKVSQLKIKLLKAQIFAARTDYVLDPKTRKPVEAVNDGKNSVTVGRAWCRKEFNEQKKVLVLHEALSLIGVEGSQKFQVSGLLFTHSNGSSGAAENSDNTGSYRKQVLLDEERTKDPKYQQCYQGILDEFWFPSNYLKRYAKEFCLENKEQVAKPRFKNCFALVGPIYPINSARQFCVENMDPIADPKFHECFTFAKEELPSMKAVRFCIEKKAIVITPDYKKCYEIKTRENYPRGSAMKDCAN